MLSNKLITLLVTFSKQDLTRFKKYLQSPFFNEDKQLLQLFDLLHPHLKDKVAVFPKNVSDKESVWKVLFPNQPFKDVKMRRLCSDLTKHALSFLAIKQFKDTPLTETTFLLDALNDGALTKQYESVCRSVADLTNSAAINNSAYYYHKFQILSNQHQFNLKKRKDFIDAFQQADHHLDCYYYLNKLKNYCGELQTKTSVQVEGQLKMPEGLFDYIKEEGFLAIPSIRAYFHVVQMFTHSDEIAHFHQLKDLVLQEPTFSRVDLNDLFTHLMNYCVRKINAGNPDFFFQLFDLYKIALEKKVILEKERLDFQHYKNIIGISLKVKAYEWVEQFIQNYTQYLIADKKDNALNYNLANVYFSQQQYDKVIAQLSTVEYKDHIYALNGKTILLKTYFELKEYQALDSLIDSFRIYIRRNKMISREVQQQYLNLLRFTKKLAGMLPRDKTNIEKISTQIQNCKALAGKNWILEKVEELK